MSVRSESTECNETYALEGEPLPEAVVPLGLLLPDFWAGADEGAGAGAGACFDAEVDLCEAGDEAPLAVGAAEAGVEAGAAAGRIEAEDLSWGAGEGAMAIAALIVGARRGVRDGRRCEV